MMRTSESFHVEVFENGTFRAAWKETPDREVAHGTWFRGGVSGLVSELIFIDSGAHFQYTYEDHAAARMTTRQIAGDPVRSETAIAAGIQLALMHSTFVGSRAAQMVTE